MDGELASRPRTTDTPKKTHKRNSWQIRCKQHTALYWQTAEAMDSLAQQGNDPIWSVHALKEDGSLDNETLTAFLKEHNKTAMIPLNHTAKHLSCSVSS